MKLGVSGSRHWKDRDAVYVALDKIRPRPRVLIHGGARGVDTFARCWAESRHVITAVVRPADPTVKQDYLRRTDVIVELSDQVLIFRASGESNGTDYAESVAGAAGKFIGRIEEPITE